MPDSISFRISFMNRTDIVDTIIQLDSSKATGLDGNSVKILKLSADCCPFIIEYYKCQYMYL